MSPSSFKKFSLPYLKYIAEHLPKRLAELEQEAVPMIVFAKGAWYALDDLCETDYNVIGLDWLHDPSEAFQKAQAKGKVIQGNADPGVLYGGREAITAVVKEMVDGFGGGKQGWIANLGHGKCLQVFARSLYRNSHNFGRYNTVREAGGPRVLFQGAS